MFYEVFWVIGIILMFSLEGSFIVFLEILLMARPGMARKNYLPITPSVLRQGKKESTVWFLTKRIISIYFSGTERLYKW